MLTKIYATIKTLLTVKKVNTMNLRTVSTISFFFGYQKTFIAKPIEFIWDETVYTTQPAGFNENTNRMVKTQPFHEQPRGAILSSHLNTSKIGYYNYLLLAHYKSTNLNEEPVIGYESYQNPFAYYEIIMWKINKFDEGIYHAQREATDSGQLKPGLPTSADIVINKKTNHTLQPIPISALGQLQITDDNRIIIHRYYSGRAAYGAYRYYFYYYTLIEIFKENKYYDTVIGKGIFDQISTRALEQRLDDKKNRHDYQTYFHRESDPRSSVSYSNSDDWMYQDERKDSSNNNDNLFQFTDQKIRTSYSKYAVAVYCNELADFIDKINAKSNKFYKMVSTNRKGAILSDITSTLKEFWKYGRYPDNTQIIELSLANLLYATIMICPLARSMTGSIKATPDQYGLDFNFEVPKTSSAKKLLDLKVLYLTPEKIGGTPVSHHFEDLAILKDIMEGLKKCAKTTPKRYDQVKQTPVYCPMTKKDNESVKYSMLFNTFYDGEVNFYDYSHQTSLDLGIHISPYLHTEFLKKICYYTAQHCIQIFMKFHLDHS